MSGHVILQTQYRVYCEDCDWEMVTTSRMTAGVEVIEHAAHHVREEVIPAQQQQDQHKQ